MVFMVLIKAYEEMKAALFGTTGIFCAFISVD